MTTHDDRSAKPTACDFELSLEKCSTAKQDIKKTYTDLYAAADLLTALSNGKHPIAEILEKFRARSREVGIAEYSDPEIKAQSIEVASICADALRACERLVEMGLVETKDFRSFKQMLLAAKNLERQDLQGMRSFGFHFELALNVERPDLPPVELKRTPPAMVESAHMLLPLLPIDELIPNYIIPSEVRAKLIARYPGIDASEINADLAMNLDNNQFFSPLARLQSLWESAGLNPAGLDAFEAKRSLMLGEFAETRDTLLGTASVLAQRGAISADVAVLLREPITTPRVVDVTAAATSPSEHEVFLSKLIDFPEFERFQLDFQSELKNPATSAIVQYRFESIVASAGSEQLALQILRSNPTLLLPPSVSDLSQILQSRKSPARMRDDEFEIYRTKLEQAIALTRSLKLSPTDEYSPTSSPNLFAGVKTLDVVLKDLGQRVSEGTIFDRLTLEGFPGKLTFAVICYGFAFGASRFIGSHKLDPDKIYENTRRGLGSRLQGIEKKEVDRVVRQLIRAGAIEDDGRSIASAENDALLDYPALRELVRRFKNRDPQLNATTVDSLD